MEGRKEGEDREDEGEFQVIIEQRHQARETSIAPGVSLDIQKALYFHPQ